MWILFRQIIPVITKSGLINFFCICLSCQTQTQESYDRTRRNSNFYISFTIDLSLVSIMDTVQILTKIGSGVIRFSFFRTKEKMGAYVFGLFNCKAKWIILSNFQYVILQIQQDFKAVQTYIFTHGGFQLPYTLNCADLVHFIFPVKKETYKYQTASLILPSINVLRLPVATPWVKI